MPKIQNTDLSILDGAQQERLAWTANKGKTSVFFLNERETARFLMITIALVCLGPNAIYSAIAVVRV